MKQDPALYWYALHFYSGLTPDRLADLVNRWRKVRPGDLRALFEAPAHELAQALLDPEEMEGLARAQAKVPIARNHLNSCRLARLRVLTADHGPLMNSLSSDFGGPFFPILFAAGSLNILSMPGVAVLGGTTSRTAITTFLEELSRHLTEQEIALVTAFEEGLCQKAAIRQVKRGGKVIMPLAQGLFTFAGQGLHLTKIIDRKKLLVLSDLAPRQAPQTACLENRDRLLLALSPELILLDGDKENFAVVLARKALLEGKTVWMLQQGVGPEIGKELESLGAQWVDWGSDEFQPWLEALGTRLQKSQYSATLEKTLPERVVLELLREGDAEEIETWCGLTGPRLSRLMEARAKNRFEDFDDVLESTGMDKRAFFEVVQEETEPAPEEMPFDILAEKENLSERELSEGRELFPDMEDFLRKDSQD